MDRGNPKKSGLVWKVYEASVSCKYEPETTLEVHNAFHENLYHDCGCLATLWVSCELCLFGALYCFRNDCGMFLHNMNALPSYAQSRPKYSNSLESGNGT